MVTLDENKLKRSIAVRMSQPAELVARGVLNVPVKLKDLLHKMGESPDIEDMLIAQSSASRWIEIERDILVAKIGEQIEEISALRLAAGPQADYWIKLAAKQQGEINDLKLLIGRLK